ncbi:MAG: TraB/GumN family protein, partial [Bacteroidia bacterium]
MQTNFVFPQSKKYQSLLWEISGNGLTKPSYLYGTMHVSKKLAFHLTEAFFESLKNADVIALESNPEIWLGELMGDSKGVLNSNVYKKYLFQYNQDFYKDAFSFHVPTDKNIQYQISKEPEDVNGLLYRYNGYSGNFEEQTYLDLFIMQAARKSGKSVASLEDYKTSMEMVTKASIPDDNEKDKYTHKSFSTYNIGEQIESAYRSGNLDALDSLNKLTYPSKKYEKYMLLDRNKIMVHSMDSLMKTQTVFTAVGAAHLPGTEGLISLLRNMGYTVKAINSEVTKNSIKLMTKYGEEHTAISFKTQYLSDSTLKLDAPGKMYDMNGSELLQQYLYTDMVNGSYYVVKRIKTFGTLMEQDAKFQFERIDKLLYESVPGKIIEKKTITANDGSLGFDILNKTDRGDFQRYQIFVRGEYVYIIKVSGTGDYVKSSDFDKFFKSIRFIAKPVSTGWTTFTPSYGGYQVSIPGNYIFEKPKDISSQVDKLTATEGFNYYIFNRSVLSDYEYIEEDTFELDQLARHFYEPLDYKLKSSKFGTYNSYPSIDVETKHKSNGSYLHIKIILKDAQYFLMACKSNETHPQEKYFSSLKFIDFKYKSFETYKDTLFHFTAKTDYKEEVQTSSLQKLLNQYSYIGKKDKKLPPYSSENENKTIESPSTGEEVKIEYYKSNDYRMDKSIDDLWKKQINYFNNNTSLKIRKKNVYEKNKIPVMDLVLSDTNTIRTILVKMIYKPGLLYVLSTMSDTLSKPSDWVSTFYDSFLPDDTLLSKSTFTDKVPEFLNDLASTDSTTKEKVNALYDVIKFEDKNAESLMKFISGKDFNNASLEVRTSLINSLGTLKNPKITPFLQTEYSKYLDSVSLQLAILNALASQKTKEANLAFVQLLKTETPLSDDEGAIGNIFNPFYDTLKIAKNMFPQLFDLTKYPEYKNNIYSLLSSLLDSSLINSQFYVEQKKDILRQANEELKRQMTSEENNTSSTSTTSTDYGNVEKEVAKAMAEAERLAKAAA